MTEQLVSTAQLDDDPVVRSLFADELPRIVDEVLVQPKIASSCAELSLDAAELRGRLLEERSAFLSATNSEISEYRSLREALGNIEPDKPIGWAGRNKSILEFLVLAAGSWPFLGGALLVSLFFHTLHWAAASGLTLLVVLVWTVVYFVVVGVAAGSLEKVVRSPTSRLASSAAIGLARFAAFAVLAAGLVFGWPYLTGALTLPGAIVTTVLMVIGQLIPWTISYGKESGPGTLEATRELQADAAAAFDAWCDAAQQVVEPAVGRLISQLAAPSYDVVLKIRDDSGLAMMTSAELAVDTAARDRFKQVLSRLSAGAVGVAGPRGVGKTTLLEAHGTGELLPPGHEHLVVRVDAPIGYEGRDFALHVFAATCQAVIGYRKLERRRWWSFRRLTVNEKKWRAFVGVAVASLDDIRYLQTRTTGWSGKLTIPGVAVDATNSRSTARARQPLTYPEIIQRLRGFLAETAKTVAAVNPNAAGTPLAVVVDELDKIDSAEHAHRFVNELKALFGVHGCHFVLSVSEDALISFERRGFSVRDAFDSAFDEIIRVEHLVLAESRKLLSSRLIGLGEPFACFCHCVSGGLPRDLIRTARAMTAIAGSPDLATVCAELTGTAVEQAARVARRELAGKPDAAALTKLADGVALARSSPEELFAAIEKLAVDGAGSSVAFELAAFLYLTLTLRQVFTNAIEESAIVRAAKDSGPGSFETLARARQAFGDNVLHAWFLTEEFRTAWGLPTVNL